MRHPPVVVSHLSHFTEVTRLLYPPQNKPLYNCEQAPQNWVCDPSVQPRIKHSQCTARVYVAQPLLFSFLHSSTTRSVFTRLREPQLYTQPYVYKLMVYINSLQSGFFSLSSPVRLSVSSASWGGALPSSHEQPGEMSRIAQSDPPPDPATRIREPQDRVPGFFIISARCTMYGSGLQWLPYVSSRRDRQHRLPRVLRRAVHVALRGTQRG